MAKTETAKAVDKAIEPSGELVAGDGVSIPADAPMPDAEPGHRVAARAVEAGVFDPNAARRLAEGRGPGLQDSEAFQPATWVQPEDIAAADLVRAERDGDAPSGVKDIRPEGEGS
jgi:hypothetical protein